MSRDRDDLKSWSKNQLVHEVRKLRHLLGEQLRAPDHFYVESGISSETYDPFVMLRWGDNAAQFGPDEARKHAQVLLEAAASAEVDAGLLTFAINELGMDVTQAGGLLIAVREQHHGNPEASATS